MDFSQSGLLLATALADVSIQMWDLSTTDPLSSSISLKPVQGQDERILALAFSPDEKHFVVADGYTVQMWNISTDRTFSAPMVLGQHGQWVLTVAISSDSHWLVAGGVTGQVTLWNLKNADPSTQSIPLRGHTATVNSTIFSKDGRWLLTTSDDTTVRLWNVNDNRAPPIILRGHEFGVRTVAFDSTQHWLVTVDNSGVGRLWKIPDQSAERADVLRNIRSDAGLAVTSLSGRWLATARGNNIELWDRTRPTAPFILYGHTRGIGRLVFSLNEHWLASSSEDSTIRLWDLTTIEHKSVTLQGNVRWIETMIFSPDNKWLAVGSWDQTISLWNLGYLSSQPFILKHDAAIRDLAFSANGNLLVSGSGDPNHSDVTARVWNLAEPDPSLNPIPLQGHMDIVKHVAISPDGRWVGTGGWDNAARLWDLSISNSSENSIILPFKGRSFPVAFSNDGHWFVAVSADGTLYAVDMTKEDKKTAPIPAHRGRVLGIKFSQDGQRFATFGEDGMTKVWNPNDLTAIPIVHNRSEADLGMVAFSPDSHLSFWELSSEPLIELACRAAGRNLSQDEWKQYFSAFPYHETCRNFSNNQVSSQHLIDIGVELAKIEHNIDEATEKFKAALRLNSKLTFDPLSEARRVAAQPLIEEGRSLAQAEKMNEAIDKFTEALALNPALEIDPTVEAKRLIVATLVDRGLTLLKSEDVTGTLAMLSQAQSISTTMILTTTLTAYEWNHLCWIGSTMGLAAKVLSACEMAVSLAPDDGGIYDSRGLALALTGDTQGAIRDFAFAIEWAKKNSEPKNGFINSRETWIEDLRVNKNPFDTTTLENLRSE